MIFDQFCGIVERLLPEFRKYVEAAKLFEFPGHQKWFSFSDHGDPYFMAEHFFLPFRTIAVEDHLSVEILRDLEKDVVGFDKERLWIECSPMANRNSNDPDEEGRERRWLKKYGVSYRDVYIVHSGIARRKVVDFEQKIHQAVGYLKTYTLCTKDSILEHWEDFDDSEMFQAATKDALDDFLTTIEMIMRFNQPDRFILEIAPVERKPRKPGGKIARSNERPIHTLLTPTEIRVKMGLPKALAGGGTGAPKAPHERRRHFRTFRSDHFTEAKGKTIIIPATWVGPHEVVRGNKRYRVLLDI